MCVWLDDSWNKSLATGCDFHQGIKCKHFLIAKGPDFDQDIRGNGHLELPLESSLVIIAEVCPNYLDRPLISPSGSSSIDRNTLQKLRVGLMQCLRMAFGSNIVFQWAAAISDRPVSGRSAFLSPFFQMRLVPVQSCLQHIPFCSVTRMERKCINVVSYFFHLAQRFLQLTGGWHFLTTKLSKLITNGV